MKNNHPRKYPGLLGLAGLLACCPFVTSCASNDQFEDRMDGRTDAYGNYQDRREIRQDARQDRTDAWYDRHMH